MVDANFTYFLCKLALPLLRKSSRASVVNVSSLAAIRSSGTGVIYAATKAAMTHMSEALACEWAGHNIRVNCVAPGLTNTDITRNGDPDLVDHLISITPMKRMAEATEIASVVKFLLSDDSSFVTGQTVPACGGRC